MKMERITLTPNYVKFKSIRGKFYWPTIQQPLHKYPRPLRRVFKTATQALDYAGSVIERYASLKAAYVPEIVIVKRRSFMELLKDWMNGIYLKIKQVFKKLGG